MATIGRQQQAPPCPRRRGDHHDEDSANEPQPLAVRAQCHSLDYLPDSGQAKWSRRIAPVAPALSCSEGNAPAEERSEEQYQVDR
eukprot:scaffold886_cov174-Ochromonas_danica.AAC.20